uniref:Uncharacterized protein n=1 Tax=viral metagenome TaxID=1070528 RepID=A0A6C0LFL3_9ZZZZ
MLTVQDVLFAARTLYAIPRAFKYSSVPPSIVCKYVPGTATYAPSLRLNAVAFVAHLPNFCVKTA